VIRKACARLEVAGEPLDLHYRLSGSGPALFLLHPSPLSSAFMQPLMKRLAHRATVIAVDTPGYGGSSGVKNPHGDLAVYAAALVALADRMGLDAYAIYGSATGAQIAIETAARDPSRVSGILLDNAAVFTDEQRAEITAGYFPDLAPDEDGGHLARAWRVAHDGTMFFPWHLPEEANRLADDPGPVEAMQATAMGCLEAGEDYHLAYRAAFANERPENLAAVEVPAVVMRWAGGMLRKYTDQLDDFAWGPNVAMAHCAADPEARWSCLDARLGALLPDSPSRAADLEIQDGGFRYLDVEGEQICYRGVEGAGGRLVLHEPGGAGHLVPPSLLAPGDLLPDLPGHGRSESDGGDIRRCVAVVGALMKEFELDRIAALGDSVTIARRVDPAATQLAGSASRAPPDLTPRAGGGHLFEAWHWLRTGRLKSGRAARDCRAMTQELVGLFRSAAAHARLFDDIGR